MVLIDARPEATPRFATVDDLERWVLSASDEDIVAVYEASGTLPLEREEYGKELIEAAKSRLEQTKIAAPPERIAAAAD